MRFRYNKPVKGFFFALLNFVFDFLHPSSTIVNKFSGGPVGIASLAVSVGEEQDTIEEVYEPYLIQAGYLTRTTRGRVATRRALARFSTGSETHECPLFDVAPNC